MVCHLPFLFIVMQIFVVGSMDRLCSFLLYRGVPDISCAEFWSLTMKILVICFLIPAHSEVRFWVLLWTASKHHLELGDPDGEREYATLKSPGHEYATLEQPTQTQGWDHQKPQPYEVPVTLTLNKDTIKSESVVLNGNHQYAKPEPCRQILNYTPQGHEDIVAMASGGREYAEPALKKSHTYATLEPPAPK